MMDSYNQLVERISSSASISKEDVERKIEAKRAKLSGLISKEGAAQIIAAELGISFDNELMKINQLIEGMKRAHVIGSVTRIFPIRSYSKNGKEGKVASFQLGDESSNIRVVLWDTNHIDLVESGKLTEGSVFEIVNASVRNGELHLSAFSDIKASKQKINEVKTSASFSDGLIKDAQQGSKARIRAVIVQLFDPKYFDDKKDPTKKRALLNIVLDDGSETIRAICGVEQASLLGLSEEEIFSLEKFAQRKNDLLGEERFFVGSFRNNTYFNKLEMSIETVEDIVSDRLIKQLEKQA